MNVFGSSGSGSSKDFTYAYFVPAIVVHDDDDDDEESWKGWLCHMTARAPVSRVTPTLEPYPSGPSLVHTTPYKASPTTLSPLPSRRHSAAAELALVPRPHRRRRR